MSSISPTIERQLFGLTADGRQVQLFTLCNTSGMQAKVTTYGATLTELTVPDRSGKFANVVLGFNNLDQYINGHVYMGATIGPYAGRIANANFTIDNNEYRVDANEGTSCLHSGETGFHRQVWQAVPIESAKGPAIKFSLLRLDGIGGFPGNLQVDLTYTLSNDNQLLIEYVATCDQKTPVNLTHHSYFNLAGAGNGSILNHELTIDADCFLPVDQSLLPTGELLPVHGTPFDFHKPRSIGQHISNAGGYDHTFVINHRTKQSSAQAVVCDPASGRAMSLWTSEAGLQFYSGNFLDGSIAGNGGTYGKHAGFCLEAQNFPDALNRKTFPDSILLPGAVYKQVTCCKFHHR